jgi:hypothetical protein
MPHPTITEVPLNIAGALVGRAASNWGWRNRQRLGASGDPMRVSVARLEELCGPIPAERIEALAGAKLAHAQQEGDVHAS